MANVPHYNCTETNLGDVDGAMYILNEHADEINEIHDDMINMRFTVWAGNKVYKRNTADDHDKNFYSYSLQVNIIM